MSEDNIQSESAPSEKPNDDIATGLGRIPSGVFILVAGNATGKKTGMLASWVQQASFEPPHVTVAVNKSRYLNSWLESGSAVTINQVAKGDSTLFRHFGKGFEPDEDAFVDLEITDAENGLPLLSDALCAIEGTVTGKMDAGDHVIYAVQVTASHIQANMQQTEPYVHLRRNGLSY